MSPRYVAMHALLTECGGDQENGGLGATLAVPWYMFLSESEFSVVWVRVT